MLPDAGDHDPPQSPMAKLVRLKDSPSGRAWLDTHPDADWDDIAKAPV